MGYKVSLFLLEISVIFLKKLNVWAKSLKCCLKTVCQLFLTMHVSYVVFSFGFVLCTLLSSLFTQGYNSFFFFSLRSRCLILYLIKVKLISYHLCVLNMLLLILFCFIDFLRYVLIVYEVY